MFSVSNDDDIEREVPFAHGLYEFLEGLAGQQVENYIAFKDLRNQKPLAIVNK